VLAAIPGVPYPARMPTGIFVNLPAPARRPAERETEMTSIIASLWFDGQAEEAADFYTSLLPDSRIEHVTRAAADNPSTSEGEVVVVAFTLLGRPFIGINGGPQFRFTEAVSFEIECEDQAEVDRYWEALVADGGEPGRCGWLKDRFGLSWQVVPRELGTWIGGPDPDGARRAMDAMLAMGKLDIVAIRRAYEAAQDS
jgi:predicted 3-demethylubiquinone-9 3-methyltransferase (glyoxalase superfamily)